MLRELQKALFEEFVSALRIRYPVEWRSTLQSSAQLTLLS